jgi:hypothetical protein
MMRRGIAPAALVVAVVVVGWLVTGVVAVDVLRFLAYDIAFVAIPGAALLWAVRGPRPTFLVALALGWPLGQALEILAFSATSSLGSRGLLLLYPIAVIIPCGLVIWRRRAHARRADDVERLSPMAMWTAAATLSAGLIYLAIMFLPQARLPSASVLPEYPDFPHFLGLITQVTYHWPPASAGLSGVPLPYEWFVFFHMAAAAQVTHISIPIIALRLDYVPTIVVVGCQLLVVGRFISRAAWTGVIAMAVAFLLGPLDLVAGSNGGLFGDSVLGHLWDSWTYAFGLMFFLALLYLIIERLRAGTQRTPSDIGAWALIALLMIGASGAKATVLPVIIVGAGLYVTGYCVLRRAPPAAAVVALGLAVVIFVATYLVVYAGGTPDTVVEPLVWLGLTPPVLFANTIHHVLVREIALPIAYVAGLAGTWLPLAGMLYLLRRGHGHEIPTFLLPLCMLGAGLVISSVVHQSSYSELYFEDMGFVAGVFIAAEGLRLAWLDLGSSLPLSRRAGLMALAAWVLLLAAAVKVTSRWSATPATIVHVYAVLGLAGALFVVGWAFVLRGHHRSASGILAVILIPILAAAMLTAPITVYPTLRSIVAGEPVTATQPVLVPGVVAALTWLREHSSIDAVVAVNNHWIDAARVDGKFYYYTALSERQVFIEAYNPIRYGITPGIASPAATTFAYRQIVNDAVFDHADATALRIMTQLYAVRFLFIDRVAGPVDPSVLQLGRVVFSNQDAAIVAVG